MLQRTTKAEHRDATLRAYRNPILWRSYQSQRPDLVDLWMVVYLNATIYLSTRKETNNDRMTPTQASSRKGNLIP